MGHRIRALAALGIAGALLTACGGDDGAGGAADPVSPSDTPSSSPTAPAEPTAVRSSFGKPATGPLMKGTGYTYRLPAGWRDNTKLVKARQPIVDTAGTEAETTDGFADNVTVGFDSAPDATLDDIEAAVPSRLEDLVAQVRGRPRVLVDGVEGVHHGGPAVDGDRRFHLEQVVTLDDEFRLGVISFSFSPDVPAAERSRSVDSVLASWRWTP